MADATKTEVEADPWEITSEHWAAKREWRTDRLPPLVGTTAALDILKVDAATLGRWCQPGSGAKTRWGGFGPDRTYMLTPAVVERSNVKLWVRSDVVVFAKQIGPQRDVAPGKPRAPGPPPPGPMSRALENVLRAVVADEPLTSTQVAQAAGRSRRTVESSLPRLVALGFVEPTGAAQSNNRRYEITGAGRRMLAQADALRARGSAGK